VRVLIERESSGWTFDPDLGHKVRGSTWASAWRAEVLYADRELVLTRSAGAEQIFHARGEGSHYGYKREHAVVVRLVKQQGIGLDRRGRPKIGRLRLAPASVQAIRDAVRRHGFVLRGDS
jgi:hypothetical protein